MRRGFVGLVGTLFLAFAAVSCGSAGPANPAWLPFDPATPTAPLPTEAPLPGLREAMGAPVVSVTDGDTFRVRLGDRTETVRVIGIDTPESVDLRRPVECYGREAASHARDLLANQEVRLVPDPDRKSVV